MAATFADKFEQALKDRKLEEPTFGLRTLARLLAGPDATHQQVEVIRRRLHKYRPPTGGGAAAVTPTAPTRWEIEDALGLERDALAPERSDPADQALRRDLGDRFELLVEALANEVCERVLTRTRSAR